jgi:hypothetical protein
MNKKRRDKLYMTSAAWKTGNIISGATFPEVEFKKQNLFHKEFKNFRRLDASSKAVCASIAPILHQKNLYPSKEKVNIPIFLGSKEGPILSDSSYYDDFLQFGGTAGRANLFVYTLPSSPLGEASVHFGLTGNISFVNSDNTLKTICNMIADHNEREKGISGYLAGLTEDHNGSINTLFLFFEESENAPTNRSINEISNLNYQELDKLQKEIEKRF